MKSMSEQTKDLTLNVTALSTSAKQLNVALEIDVNELNTQLRPYTVGFVSLKLSAERLEVTDNETNQQCVNMMNDAAARQKGLKAIWSLYKTPLNKAREIVLELEAQTCGEAERIKKQLAAKSAAYGLLQRKAKMVVEREIGVDAAKIQRALETEAEDLMYAGRVEEAQQKFAQAEMVTAPELPDAVHRPENSRQTDGWAATCDDTIALLKAIVDGKVPLMHEFKPGDERPLVVVDQVVLNAIVKRLGDGLRWPGIKVEPTLKVGARSGK